MSNPHVEVGSWWKEIHDGDVRQVTDVHAHGVHLACNECGVGELFRWSQFTPFWELAPGPKEESDVEKLLKLEQLLREALGYLEHAPPSLTGTKFLARDEMRDTFKAILKKAGLE